VITAIIHVCQAPFDHGLDVVLCLVVYPVDIVAKTECDIWLFSPCCRWDFLPGPKNEYYFLVVLLNQCTIVGSKLKKSPS
jgi:hypothetical protein